MGDIFKDEQSKQVFSTAASARMTQNSHRKKSLQAIRRASKGTMPPQPKTLEEIVLPDWCLKIGETEERIVKYDSGPESGPNRFYILATDADIERLINSPKVYGDGSFMRPNKKLFAQGPFKYYVTTSRGEGVKKCHFFFQY